MVSALKPIKMTQRINGHDLLELGYPEGPSLGIALKANKKRNQHTREEMLSKYKSVLENPEAALEDPLMKDVAAALIAEREKPSTIISLNNTPPAYAIYGEGFIEKGAREQMDTAIKLPVAVAGALMPDAHAGYGLPIGGVLAARNAVIPFGVGVDIGCRMALSVYDIPENYFNENRSRFRRELIAQTIFGAGQGYKGAARAEHAVLDNASFGMNNFVSQLKDRAWSQLGTSGGGNHFAEFGILELSAADEIVGLEAGRYLALLTHSGSRGLGATIAGHYTQLAKQICQLPHEAVNLAYLGLDTQEGQEYWEAMNLAGDYASACHEVIHNKIAAAIGGQVLAKVENHHNFAWKEQLNGEEVIVHRKGATPAAKGVMGIIPGSMAAPGFLVRGRGTTEAINSASHGAGRQMSRTAAVKNLSKEELKSALVANEVELIGGGMDEAPMAYKDIHQVMAAQTDLVDVIATFKPRLVRMAADGSRED
jgi:tRNA-splicing ligase RtcB